MGHPPKSKVKSDRTFGGIAVSVMRSSVGYYATTITSLYVQWVTDRLKNSVSADKKWLGLIQECSMKLLASVDSRKHEPAFDFEVERLKDKERFKGYFQGWQRAKDEQSTWLYGDCPVGDRETDFDRWITFVNRQWISCCYNAEPLTTFQSLFGQPSSADKIAGKEIQSRLRGYVAQDNMDSMPVMSESEFRGLWWLQHDRPGRSPTCTDANACLAFIAGWSWITGLQSRRMYLVSRLSEVGQQVVKVIPPQGFRSGMTLIRRDDEVHLYSVKKGDIGIVKDFPIDAVGEYEVIVEPVMLKSGELSHKSFYIGVDC